VSYALRCHRVLERAEDDAEHCTADLCLAHGSPVADELGQLLTGGVIAADQRDQRPCCDVLDEAHQQAA
jgi:hypothetical protein